MGTLTPDADDMVVFVIVCRDKFMGLGCGPLMIVTVTTTMMVVAIDHGVLLARNIRRWGMCG